MANELFRNKGYEAVTVEEICAKAGITKSTFYYHFASKDNLLSHFFQGVGRDNGETIANIIETNDCWMKLVILLNQETEWVNYIGKDIFTHGLICGLSTGMQPFSHRHRPKAVKLQCSIIKKGQEEGRFLNKAKPEEIYEAIYQAFIGSLYEWCSSSEENYDDEKYKSLVKSILFVQDT